MHARIYVCTNFLLTFSFLVAFLTIWEWIISTSTILFGVWIVIAPKINLYVELCTFLALYLFTTFFRPETVSFIGTTTETKHKQWNKQFIIHLLINLYVNTNLKILFAAVVCDNNFRRFNHNNDWLIYAQREYATFVLNLKCKYQNKSDQATSIGYKAVVYQLFSVCRWDLYFFFFF